jgi:tetratricopeptide (TPR) repeat protein
VGDDAGIAKCDEIVKQGLAAWLASQQQGSSQAEEEPAPELAEACALFAAAKKHHDSNMFSEGEQLVRRAVELRARVLGAENSETLAANLLLASLLKKQKKMDEAKIVYEEALAAARRVLGDDSEDTLACMNNLAVLLKQQGKLDDARALYEEALKFKRSKLGAQHASTLTSMSNLAGLLKAQGKLEEARVLYVHHLPSVCFCNTLSMYEESLQGHRSTLGSLHPDTLTDIWNFALFLNKVA